MINKVRKDVSVYDGLDDKDVFKAQPYPLNRIEDIKKTNLTKTVLVSSIGIFGQDENYVVYETMIRGISEGPWNEYQERHGSIPEAIVRHDEIVRMMSAGLDPNGVLIKRPWLSQLIRRVQLWSNAWKIGSSP